MFLLLVLTCLKSKGQFSLQPRVGMNENKHAVFALDIAYKLGCLEPAVTIDDVQHNTEPAFFNFRIGYRIPVAGLTVMPLAGQAYRYMSNDKQNENYWLFMAGLRLEKHLPCMIENSAVFIQGDYSDQFQVTIGVRF